jgi:Holliday junction DNA helicase RuvA
MISRIEGPLVELAAGRAEVRCDPVTYEVLVPAADLPELAGQVGRRVKFHTLHFLEGQSQGSSFVPRLIGFQTVEDRAFFELFTTVKGVGPRKALRALQLPFAAVAQAIASKDLTVLIGLPEIGKRTAETIIAELHDRVNRFVELKPAAIPGAAGATAESSTIEDAVTVLVQLGENRIQARDLVARALNTEPDVTSADNLVAAAYRLKEGA